MKLIDSSAWIEFFRSNGDMAVADLVEAALREDEAAVNGLIFVEVEGFSRDERERQMIDEDFKACRALHLGDEVYKEAAAIAFDARRKGLTIPATDCIIAANALVAGAILVHRDRHFADIAKLRPLLVLTRP
ncbi:MAG: PIN domain-containing protein [Treponema sp.]|nr:PIN domain-containing protein [Treponema sp.]